MKTYADLLSVSSLTDSAFLVAAVCDNVSERSSIHKVCATHLWLG